VAIASSYLLNRYRDSVKRVAIIDFDVHHGNGTQEIIECMQQPKVFREQKNSSILFDNDPRSTTQYRPWLGEEDGKNVFFASVHLHGKQFYPNTGGISKQDQEEQEKFSPGGILNIPIYPGAASSYYWRKQFSD
jgi:acetoin utilization deacetylase AcuC-like enzyme